MNYRELSDVRLPRKRQRTRLESADTDQKLYRLRIVEEDNEIDFVKVRYLGYGSEDDEWRAREDIVILDDDEEAMDSEPVMTSTIKPFCLYDELAYKIKSCLMSDRKRDPFSRISIPFDAVYFDGLVRRGTVLKKTKFYTILRFKAFNYILGERWYVRGMNSAGDFCYIKPETVRPRQVVSRFLVWAIPYSAGGRAVLLIMPLFIIPI